MLPDPEDPKSITPPPMGLRYTDASSFGVTPSQRDGRPRR
eukprot:SAG11_NODE_40051_length_212_cov_152.495575_1_plen_39_part_10